MARIFARLMALLPVLPAPAMIISRPKVSDTVRTYVRHYSSRPNLFLGLAMYSAARDFRFKRRRRKRGETKPRSGRTVAFSELYLFPEQCELFIFGIARGR